MPGWFDTYWQGQVDVFDWLTGDVSSDDERIAPIHEDLVHDAWSWCFTHNLAIGASLCRSYEMGVNPPPVGDDLRIAGGVVPAADWRPGCGRAAA